MIAEEIQTFTGFRILAGHWCRASPSTSRPLHLRCPLVSSLMLDSHRPSHDERSYLCKQLQTATGNVELCSSDVTSFTTRLMACSPLHLGDSWVTEAKLSSRFNKWMNQWIKMKEMLQTHTQINTQKWLSSYFQQWNWTLSKKITTLSSCFQALASLNCPANKCMNGGTDWSISICDVKH